jgi:hypothetical protein
MRVSGVLASLFLLPFLSLMCARPAAAQPPDLEALEAKLKRLEKELRIIELERERAEVDKRLKEMELQRVGLVLERQKQNNEKLAASLTELKTQMERLTEALRWAQTSMERLEKKNAALKREVEAARRANEEQQPLDIALEAFVRVLAREDITPSTRLAVLETLRTVWGPKRRGLPGVLTTFSALLEDNSAPEGTRLVVLRAAGELGAAAEPLLPVIERTDAAGSDVWKQVRLDTIEWIRAASAKNEKEPNRSDG